MFLVRHCDVGRVMVTSWLLALHNALWLLLATVRTALAQMADPIWTYDFSFDEVVSANYQYERKHCVYR